MRNALQIPFCACKIHPMAHKCGHPQLSNQITDDEHKTVSFIKPFTVDVEDVDFCVVLSVEPEREVVTQRYFRFAR